MTTLSTIGSTLVGGSFVTCLSVVLFGVAVSVRHDFIAPRATARPRNVIYNAAAAVRNDPHHPQYRGGNPFTGWIGWTLSLSYDTLLKGIPGTGTRNDGLQGSLLRVTLDGVVLLRFHALCLKVTALATAVWLCCAMPMYISAHCSRFNKAEQKANLYPYECATPDTYNLTNYERTTIANVPSLSDATTAREYMIQSIQQGIILRLYVVVICFVGMTVYLLHELKLEWITVLAMRRVYYLEYNVWGQRREELKQTLLFEEYAAAAAARQQEQSQEEPSATPGSKLQKQQQFWNQQQQQQQQGTTSIDAGQQQEEHDENMCLPSSAVREQAAAMERRPLTGGTARFHNDDDNNDNNNPRDGTLRSEEQPSKRQFSTNQDSSSNNNNNNQSIPSAAAMRKRLRSPQQQQQQQNSIPASTFIEEENQKRMLKRDPWIPHPEQRETVPNVALYSVLVGGLPSLPHLAANAVNTEATIAFSKRESIDWQLLLTATFFDHCVPNQPGFSSSVAAVTIIPGARHLSAAWKKWYKAASKLRRLRFIRQEIAKRRHYEIMISSSSSSSPMQQQLPPDCDEEYVVPDEHGNLIPLTSKATLAPSSASGRAAIDPPGKTTKSTPMDTVAGAGAVGTTTAAVQVSNTTSEATPRGIYLDASKNKAYYRQVLMDAMSSPTEAVAPDVEGGYYFVFEDEYNFGPEQTAVYSREFAQAASQCCPNGCNEARVYRAKMDALLKMERQAAEAVHRANLELKRARQRVTLTHHGDNGDDKGDDDDDDKAQQGNNANGNDNKDTQQQHQQGGDVEMGFGATTTTAPSTQPSTHGTSSSMHQSVRPWSLTTLEERQSSGYSMSPSHGTTPALGTTPVTLQRKSSSSSSTSPGRTGTVTPRKGSYDSTAKNKRVQLAKLEGAQMPSDLSMEAALFRRATSTDAEKLAAPGSAKKPFGVQQRGISAVTSNKGAHAPQRAMARSYPAGLGSDDNAKDTFGTAAGNLRDLNTRRATDPNLQSIRTPIQSVSLSSSTQKSDSLLLSSSTDLMASLGDLRGAGQLDMPSLQSPGDMGDLTSEALREWLLQPSRERLSLEEDNSTTARAVALLPSEFSPGDDEDEKWLPGRLWNATGDYFSTSPRDGANVNTVTSTLHSRKSDTPKNVAMTSVDAMPQAISTGQGRGNQNKGRRRVQSFDVSQLPSYNKTQLLPGGQTAWQPGHRVARSKSMDDMLRELVRDPVADPPNAADLQPLGSDGNLSTIAESCQASSNLFSQEDLEPRPATNFLNTVHEHVSPARDPIDGGGDYDDNKPGEKDDVGGEKELSTWALVESIVAESRESESSRENKVLDGVWHHPTFKDFMDTVKRVANQIQRWAQEKSVRAMEHAVDSLARDSTYAVVTFTSRQAAVAARHCLADGRGSMRWVSLPDIPIPPLADAPPCNICDCRSCCRPVTLSINNKQKFARNYIALTFLFGIYFLYTVPLTIAARLLEPSSLQKISPKLVRFLESMGLTKYVSGLLSSCVSSFFFSMCPSIFKSIANFGSNATSVANAEYTAMQYYWWFMILTAFSANLLANMILNGMDDGLTLGAQFVAIVRSIALTVPSTLSASWLNWIVFRFTVTLPFSYLLQINTFLFDAIGWNCCSRCMRGGGPGPPIPYRIYIDSGTVLMCALALAPASPLVAPACFFYFLFCQPILRRNVIFSYRPNFDGGGLRFPFIAEMVVSALIVSQILLAAQMGLKGAIGPAVICTALIPATFLYHAGLKRRFLQSFEDAALLQTSLLDGWDTTEHTTIEKREEFRRFLVDAHKAAYVPVCIAAADTDNLMTAEPAVVVPLESELFDYDDDDDDEETEYENLQEPLMARSRKTTQPPEREPSGLLAEEPPMARSMSPPPFPIPTRFAKPSVSLEGQQNAHQQSSRRRFASYDVAGNASQQSHSRMPSHGVSISTTPRVLETERRVSLQHGATMRRAVNTVISMRKRTSSYGSNDLWADSVDTLPMISPFDRRGSVFHFEQKSQEKDD